MRFTVRGDASSLLGHTDHQEPAAVQGWMGLASSCRPLSPLFASIGSAVVGGRSGPPAPVKERRTGTTFPGELEYCAGQKGCPVITGAGARTKRLAGIKNLDIYALALYVDQAAAHRALHAKFRGAAPEALAANQALFDDLVQQEGVEKTLSIVITSKLVRRRAFLDALEERLEPPLKKAGELAALEAFKAQFDDANFRKGLEITFIAKGNKLLTRVDGREFSIANCQLQRCLLEIYVGRDPASKGAKEAFGKGLAAMVLA